MRDVGEFDAYFRPGSSPATTADPRTSWYFVDMGPSTLAG